jgi:hypothetical protein
MILVSFLVLLISVPTAVLAAKQGAGEAQAQINELIDEEAVEVITRFVKYITSLKELRVTAEYGFDVLQETGQMIEFGSRQEITVQRPDHLRVDFSRRDGVAGHVVYDGNEVVLFNPEHAVYAKAPFKGEVDDVFDFLAEELQRPVPLRDLFASDLGDVLVEKVDSALYVGESTVGEVLCDHLAMRNENVDFQLWVAQGDKPLLHRMIITHKNEEGQPQFWSQFLKWDTSPRVKKGDFSYTPPKGAERIPFAVLEEEVPPQGGQP